ncbi:hypothetical protein [Actinomadura sp. 21ATH]|uniref:hypothetical protein n=1 Tax=Actinomadura sp. 21ATH TaxID=1735444 RepID=UPI0035C157FE
MPGRTIKVAAAALAAVATLAACGGGPVKMGAAALVGDERIATATLDQAVVDWRREFRADQRANQIRAANEPRGGGGEPLVQSDPRRALDMLVYFRIGDEVARRNGITVTGGQVDGLTGELDRRVGAASLTRAQGLPGRYAPDLARVSLVQQLLAQKLGATPGPAATQQNAIVQQQIRQRFVETARSMKIKINPRFGTFDPSTITINAGTPRLSGTESGTR